MKEAAKKILVRWLIIELLVSLVILALTPFLFGSIKPFKHQVMSLKPASSVKINEPLIALKKAVKKASVNEAKKLKIKEISRVTKTINNDKKIRLPGKDKPQIIGILPGEDNPQIID